MKLSSKISVDKDISRAKLIDPEFYTSDNYFQATKNIFLSSDKETLYFIVFLEAFL